MAKHISDQNYYTIQGWMVTRLNLRANDLIIYAIVYSFSQDGDSAFTGSINYLSEFSQASRRTVIVTLTNLVKQNLIIKESNVVNGVTFNKYRANLDLVASLIEGNNELEKTKKYMNSTNSTENKGSAESAPPVQNDANVSDCTPRAESAPPVQNDALEGEIDEIGSAESAPPRQNLHRGSAESAPNNKDYTKEIDIDRKIDRSNQSINQSNLSNIQEEILKNIELELLVEMYPEHKTLIAMIYKTILGVFKNTDTKIRIGKNVVDIESVRNCFKDLRYEHITYVLANVERREKQGSMISNYKAYLMTTLYNAKQSYESNYADNVTDDELPECLKEDTNGDEVIDYGTDFTNKSLDDFGFGMPF